MPELLHAARSGAEHNATVTNACECTAPMTIDNLFMTPNRRAIAPLFLSTEPDGPGWRPDRAIEMCSRHLCPPLLAVLSWGKAFAALENRVEVVVTAETAFPGEFLGALSRLGQEALGSLHAEILDLVED